MWPPITTLQRIGLKNKYTPFLFPKLRHVHHYLFTLSTQAGVSMGGDASKPGMAVGVEVLPGINGVISSGKITSLFSVLDYVTKVT